MNPQMNQPHPQHQPMQSSYNGDSSSSRLPWLVLAIAMLIVLGVLGYVFRDKLGMTKSSNQLSGYQAVFLSNGQVYFGKVSNPSSDYVTLKDIYYLQVNQPLQSGQTASQPSAEQPQLSLVKLGNELHGPVDSMQINHTQILFYEDLKSDGKVSQAIESYKKNGSTATAPATQAPRSQTAPVYK
ncbi:MAG: hypothetical protein NVSMB66_6840 [Candidatus Doudnabacteria bacterium]